MRKIKIKNIFKKKKMEKKFLKKGTKIKVNKDTCHHHYVIGSTLTFVKYHDDDKLLIYVEEGSAYLRLDDFDVALMTIDSFKEKLVILDNEIKKLTEEKNVIQTKIDYMVENKITEYNESQYKIYQTLKTLENCDISSIEKAKIISELMN